jgi:hypothetical protein
MPWGVITGKGIGPLHAVKGTIRKEEYKQVLDNCVFPKIKEWYPESCDMI